jgi:hypothetical protein
MSLLQSVISDTDRNAGWERRALEKTKRLIQTRNSNAVNGVIDATPKTRVVGNVKIKNMRPLVRALVERRARELMAKQLLALTELSKRGLLEPAPKQSGVRLVEPALM